MTEPTPLSAEELASVKPIPGDEQWCYYCGFSWPGCFCARAKVTIDAQATEIAILKDGRCVSCMESCNPLHPKCACIRAEIAEMEAEIAALKGQRDKAETTLEMVNALATGYGWLSEGRGMYAYDDGRYDDDVRTFVGQLLELMPSGNWLGFPEWEAKYRAMEAEIAALKGALEAKEREMLAEHSSAMQALLRWCAEDTPEDIRKGWEQESHEALRALAAGRPR